MEYDIKNIRIEDYNYNLPKEFIAQRPVAKRDESKLLIALNNNYKADSFKNIHNYIAKDSVLVFNDTKVIKARLVFYKETGARIEIFLLEPFGKIGDMAMAFAAKNEISWKAYVGNAKKWKDQTLKTKIKFENKEVELRVEKLEKQNDSFIVKFNWDDDYSFSELLEVLGKTPLPPYMNRESDKEDTERYQTVYARNKGSVAAPTAGLHFTGNVMDKLKNKGVDFKYISLHVGAGTFKPVDSETIENHEMHTEKIIISKDFIEYLVQNSDKNLYAVGTTSTRSLESMYWHGVKLLKTNSASEMEIKQWEAYDLEKHNISLKDSLKAIIDNLEKHNLNYLKGETALIIVPSYKFKVVNRLITNFHQPKSTLLLLVSAFYGDGWKQAYDFALNNKFRFLSYGDSCLF